jgi:predicted dehydrogenase/threonine dehydrogenase-like Zn-dependent dehydrogenase
MKQVVAEAGKVTVIDVPRPVCAENEVLVETRFSLISTGTEMWSVEATEAPGLGYVLRDTSKFEKAIRLAKRVFQTEGIGGLSDYIKSVRRPLFPLGYSVSGVVVEVGKQVMDLTVGDRVACAGEGRACHAEFVTVPRNLIAKIPDKVSFEDAAFTTVGAIALHGVRRSDARIGESVVVIGVGLVGNLVVQICKAAGCRVVAVDARQSRLELASKVGADIALQPTDPKLLEHVMHFTSGRGADSVIIAAATSSNEPINLAASLARDKARIVVLGRVGMSIERREYYQKELEMHMSRSLGPGRYDPVYEELGVDYPIGHIRWTLGRNMEAFLDLVSSGKLNLSALHSEKYPVESALQAYDSLKRDAAVAVLLSYGAAQSKEDEPTSKVVSVRSRKDSINVALIGPGNFAKETLIPVLRANPSFNLKWVVAHNPVHAMQVAQRYRFEKSGTDYEEVLRDPEIDLVVISTPNNLHFPMLIQAAKAGRAVFVEKPLCINSTELDEIVKVQKATQVPIFVGFNRRYSSLIRAVKRELEMLDPPFLVDYIVNADYIPASRWVQDPLVGGGRLIAEGCHFFDLFNFLFDSYPSAISATSTGIDASNVVTRDNFVATLKYPDGSIASLAYSALGNRAMKRERIHVFGQGVAMFLDDFFKLEIYRTNGTRRVKLRSQDKGHKAEFEQLAACLRGEDSTIINFTEAVMSTRLTLEVEKAIRSASESKGSQV